MIVCCVITVGGCEIKGDASASSCRSWSQALSPQVVTRQTTIQPLRLTRWWRAVVPDWSVPTQLIISLTHAHFSSFSLLSSIVFSVMMRLLF